MQTSGSNSAASREGRRRGCLMGWGGARRGEDRDCERRTSLAEVNMSFT